MKDNSIKLYAWQPDGHGEYSFYVTAYSKEQAIAAVEKHMQDDPWEGNFLESGWGTDYYQLTVLDVGQVITNAND